jgi:hypothetical protein
MGIIEILESAIVEGQELYLSSLREMRKSTKGY